MKVQASIRFPLYNDTPPKEYIENYMVEEIAGCLKESGAIHVSEVAPRNDHGVFVSHPIYVLSQIQVDRINSIISSSKDIADCDKELIKYLFIGSSDMSYMKPMSRNDIECYSREIEKRSPLMYDDAKMILNNNAVPMKIAVDVFRLIIDLACKGEHADHIYKIVHNECCKFRDNVEG